MIKRFNPDFSLSISHELAYMRETPEGGYVAHGDYATLFSELEVVKAERDALAERVERLSGMLTESRHATKAAVERADALAVENAERGEIIERLIGIFTASGYHAMQNSYDPCMALLYDAFQAIKHTATDASLAEIKAQGLDELANACDGYAENHVYTFTKRHAKAFAAELREAK